MWNVTFLNKLTKVSVLANETEYFKQFIVFSDLKKVGKITRPFRYDLNQIPYDYTVEMRNRFKGLDLIDIVPDELWNEVGRRVKLKCPMK